MEYISFIVIILRNIPKHLFNILTGILRDILAPIIAPNIPNIAIIVPFFMSKFLFFIAKR